MEVDGYELYAEPVEERAKREADDLDNAFGNLLRGSNLDGIAVVLEEEGEEIDVMKIGGEDVAVKDAAVEAAYELAEEYGFETGVLDYEALER